LIGNSITHFWGGEPKLKNVDGSVRQPNGPEAWNSAFGSHRVLKLGFGWDRTQNVLWRIKNGELDRLHPLLVIIHISTNNTNETKNAVKNSATEIAEGVRVVCKKVNEKLPDAKILLMAIMPREEKPDHPRRLLINETNQLISDLAQKPYLTLIDIGHEMLSKDGTLSREIAKDLCHPTEKGYQIWADKLRPYIEETFKHK
jgi:lysophospholipase L1-like esterase